MGEDHRLGRQGPCRRADPGVTGAGEGLTKPFCAALRVCWYRCPQEGEIPMKKTEFVSETLPDDPVEAYNNPDFMDPI